MDISNIEQWYLAGPMSNIPQFNVPAFLAARDDLVSRGYSIQLPADLDDPEIVELLLQSDGTHSSVPNVPTWGECLAADVKLIADVVGGVIVLPGWKSSRGARLETYVSYMLCNKPVIYYSTLTPVPARDLASAYLGPELWDEVLEVENAVVNAVTRRNGISVALVH